MLLVNEKNLTNAEIIEALGGRIERPIKFSLTEQFQSVLRYIYQDGSIRNVVRMQETFGLSNSMSTKNFKDGGTDRYTYYTHTQVRPGKDSSDRIYLVGESLTKIEFLKGFLTVDVGQEDLLLFLRKHEQNKTNPVWGEVNRFKEQVNRPVKAFLFKEIIPEKEDALSYDIIHMRLKAQTAALDPKRIPYSRAVMMATAYNLPNPKDKGEKSVRQFLYNQATAQPEQFLTDMASNKFELKATVQSAISLRIIKFDSPYMQWTEKKSRRTGEGRICQIASGRDPVDYFVDWLRETDKSGVMEELKKMVEVELESSEIVEPKLPNVDLAVEAAKLLGYNSVEEAMSALSELKKLNEAPVKTKKKPVELAS